MKVDPEIEDLHVGLTACEALWRLNNANARETSHLARDRFDQLIAAARIVTFIPPNAAFLIAFEQDDGYDGGHFLWFRRRFAKFIYIDRIVVGEQYRRHGLARALYADLFARVEELGHTVVTCEVNLLPPNPVSDAFHAACGFQEVGRATLNDGATAVRYLCRRHSAGAKVS
jgi:predicted GNAT superfamily acetyltransferase